MDQAPSDDNFMATIMTSLPASSTVLMEAILDDYDRRASKTKKGSSNDNADDAAYSAGGSGKPKTKFKGNCYKCGKRGHRSKECKSGEKGSEASKDSKGKDKDDKSKSKCEHAAAALNNSDGDSEPDGVWLACIEVSENREDEVYSTTYDSALLANEGARAGVQVELYDSGASRHMSSYREQFVTYNPIPPKPITTANGKARSRVLLKDVLYAPRMGVMLISISRLDQAGYAALFRDSRKGLYTIRAPKKLLAGIASAKEPLTMEEIHVRLGHLAP